MAIAVIDNDVMVYVFEDLYHIDRENFKKVVDFLVVRFNEIWIPKVVKKEFYSVKNKKRRSRVLTKIKKEYETIRDCPVKVSMNEITSIIPTIDKGEADAIMQIMKVIHLEKKIHNDILFFSNDKKAIEFAENAGLSVLKYKDLREELREMGIELPS